MVQGRYAFLSDWVRARIRTHLDELGETLQETIRALDRGVSCDILLGNAADLGRHVRQAEEIILEYHLQTCLLPEMHGLSEIGVAVARLAERRVGALLAVERRVPIGELVRAGVPLDAKLLARVLESIFYPGNPLHDGGAIIRGDRIIAAASVFPLAAVVLDTTRKFGTRHRAAVGLSEQSDALVIVVSEETGNVSIAIGGRLYPVPDTQRMVDQILTLSGKM